MQPQTMKVGNREYSIIGYAVSENTEEKYPIVDIPMMSDYKWQLESFRSRLKHPEVYREFLGEDVELVVSRLMSWLLSHGATMEELEKERQQYE